ncbi:hypothetical protein CN152_27695 [Sinorhizobium meliloti]|nr:hypothetical protein CN152_27695 [Sinorhizobium meliloti]RVN39473.1 hypothetical protein CN113_28415 [Sinorhizobium meliloti]
MKCEADIGPAGALGRDLLHQAGLGLGFDEQSRHVRSPECGFLWSDLSPQAAGESHLANKRLFCCGKSILGVLR